MLCLLSVLAFSPAGAQDLFLYPRVHDSSVGAASNCCWGGSTCGAATDCHTDAYCGTSQDNCEKSCSGTWCPSGPTPSPPAPTPTPTPPAPTPPSPTPPPTPPSPVPPATGCGETPQSISTDTVSNQGKFSVWDDTLGVLLWVDSPAYTQGAWKGSIVYAFRPGDGKTFTVAQYDDDIVGSVMPRKGGGIVLAISRTTASSISYTFQSDSWNSGFYSMDVDPQTFKGSNLALLASLPAGSPGKFNNGNSDPMGRYWAGTYCPDGGSCSVWVLDRSANGYSVRKGISDIQHPNGLVWNEAGTQLLFSNTGMNAVFKYSYSLTDGTASNATRFIQGGAGLLDSMCGLEDGSLVIANPGSSQLQRYGADGEVSCTIKVPSNFVASCAFAPNGDLYIPTGRNGGSATGPAGWLFKTTGLGPGVKVTPVDA